MFRFWCATEAWWNPSVEPLDFFEEHRISHSSFLTCFPWPTHEIFFCSPWVSSSLFHTLWSYSAPFVIQYSCIIMPNLLTCLFMILYGFFSYRVITTSWWFILFSLAVIVDSLDCAYSVNGDMRYMVYGWGFPYLDYPLEVSISWIRLLSPYN